MSVAPTLAPHNLPSELTRFIGREREVATVADLLRGHRLTTLAGSGGVGKTRLALRVAAALLEEYPGGTWFVDLSPLAVGELVEAATASAVGVAGRSGLGPEGALTDTTTQLIEDLRGRSTLLVFDNCEHVVVDSSDLIARLLDACPDLTVVATSRQPLGVTGEAVWTVPPLTADESVDLFVDRARLREPGFALTADDAVAVSELVVRLDGIPLAIELAAARVNVLTPCQIENRLDDHLALLQAGGVGRPARQRTLRAVLDWSYELLSEPERVLMARLAVFEGGWTLDAAERVCAAGVVRPADVLDLLSSLVDKSLVVRQRAGAVSRFRLLDSVRQYAWERLGSMSLVAPEPTLCIFRRDGEYWTIGFEGDIFRLRDSKGLTYFRVLLSSPGHEVHALELTGARAGDAGDVLDAGARAAYKERLSDLGEEMEEARAFNDIERIARIEVEIDALVQQLSEGFGLGGRSRKAASASERARVSVTKAVRTALDRIGEHSLALRRHLDATIRTGTFCSYTPDPRSPISWDG